MSFVNSRWRNTLDLYDLSAGTSRVLLTHTPFLWGPAVSPDGREVAFSRSEEDGAWHIWTIDLSSGTSRRLTAGEAGEVYPRYSPDGTSLWFHTWIAPRRIGHVPARGGPLEMVPLTGEQAYRRSYRPTARPLRSAARMRTRSVSTSRRPVVGRCVR